MTSLKLNIKIKLILKCIEFKKYKINKQILLLNRLNFH